MSGLCALAASWWAIQTPEQPPATTPLVPGTMAQTTDINTDSEIKFIDRPLRIRKPKPIPPPPKKPVVKKPAIDKEKKKQERRRQREEIAKRAKPILPAQPPKYQLLQTVIESNSRRAYFVDATGSMQAVTEDDVLDQLKPKGGIVKQIASGEVVVVFKGADFKFKIDDGTRQ